MLAKKLDVGFPNAKWCMYGTTYDSLTWLDDSIPKPTLEEIETAYERAASTYALKLLREKRDKLLKETDIYMIPDYPISDTKKERLLQYRRALRDLPSLSNPRIIIQEEPVERIVLDEASVTWPVLPL